MRPVEVGATWDWHWPGFLVSCLRALVSLRSFWDRAEYEMPRHAKREAGLLLTSDCCPVTPGSSTRHGLVPCHENLGVPGLVRLERATKPCPRSTARAEVTLGWRHGSSARCWSTRPPSDREERKRGAHHAGPRSTRRDDERHFEMLSRGGGMSRAAAASRRSRIQPSQKSGTVQLTDFGTEGVRSARVSQLFGGCYRACLRRESAFSSCRSRSSAA
jgi:hypothetical protein